MRVGFIGFGAWAKRRVEVMPEADPVVGIVDPALVDAPVATARYFDDIRSLVTHTKPDAVVIATTTDALTGCARDVLDCGVRRVLIEKPGAVYAEDLESLGRVADAQGAHVSIGYTLIHYPAIQRILREPGAADYVHIRYGHPGRPGYEKEWRCTNANGGGELLDQGSHAVHLARAILGRELRVRDAKLDHLRWGETVEDTASLTLGGRECRAEVFVSWAIPPTFRLDVVCASGESWRVTGLGGGYGPHTLERYDRAGDLAERVEYGDCRKRALAAEWAAFARDPHPVTGVEAGVKVLRVLEAARGVGK